MKTARVLIQVIKVFEIEVEVNDDGDWADAEGAAYGRDSIWIQENGILQDVETDFAEFQSWVDEEDIIDLGEEKR
jgi:hypothetical protein